MVVCKFFAQGHCRYGNGCFNEHVRPASNAAAFGGGGGGANRFQALAGHEGGAREAQVAATNPYLSPANAASIVDEICKEMDNWEKSGMWPFSCFGFAKDVPCIPGYVRPVVVVILALDILFFHLTIYVSPSSLLFLYACPICPYA